MKQYKTTIISLAVIAVVLIAFFVVSSILDKDEAEAPVPTASQEVETERVFGFASVGDIVTYECNVVDEIKLEREGEKEWKCTSYSDIELYAAGINSALNSVKSCMAAAVYEGEITEEIIKTYGISRTQYIRIVLKDGTIYTLRFGMKKPGTDMYFGVVEEKNKVYLINSTYKDASVITKENILYTQVFDFKDTGKIKNMEVYKKGELFVSLSSKFTEESRTWTMSYPLERPGEDTYIEEIIDSVSALFTSQYIEGDCKDLSKYGLDNPSYVLKLTDNNGQQTLSLGDRIPEGGEFYCLFGGSNNVFTVSMSAVAFTDDTAIKYLDTDIFTRSYTVLKSAKIEITCAGINETYTLGYEIKGEDEKLFFNGVQLSDDYDTIRAFRKVNTAIYSINLVGLDEEPQTKGELLLRITYTMAEGDEVVVVEGYRADETTMSIYENGSYCGGYEYIRQITGDVNSYGIMGTIENFKQISGMK